MRFDWAHLLQDIAVFCILILFVFACWQTVNFLFVVSGSWRGSPYIRINMRANVDTIWRNWMLRLFCVSVVCVYVRFLPYSLTAGTKACVCVCVWGGVYWKHGSRKWKCLCLGVEECVSHVLVMPVFCADVSVFKWSSVSLLVFPSFVSSLLLLLPVSVSVFY